MRVTEDGNRGEEKKKERERKLILAEIISIIDICFDESRGAQKP